MQPTMNALAQSLQPTELSIVVPAHNEQGNLRQLSFELRNALSPLAGSWELIFVDDGSTDDTWSQIRSLHEEDGRIRGIRLSRNFGHQGALMAGMTHARGDAVISMDADLQHPPAVVPAGRRMAQRQQIVKTVRRPG
jgi:dolichol-phosphate mannosyltransferase